ncbi:MAG: UbiD family decarboxylase [Bdellovibrionales bacterium]|nr:UbiD family decarboxylase [Bdellovibrionales bacterium]
MYSNLHQYLDTLRKEQELLEISVPVSSDLEIAEIHRRAIAQGGPALLFRNVIGAKFPLVTNLFGTQRRVELAFGLKPKRFIESLVDVAKGPVPPRLSTLWKERRSLAPMLKLGMKRTRRAPILESQQTPSRLSSLPLLKTWKDDGGHFITLPLVLTADPETHQTNLGMYRIQRYDDETTGLHCQIGKGGGYHLARAKELNTKLPVHIAIGGPPALILSAIAPLPENVPELVLCSLLMNQKVSLVQERENSLPLLGEADFILAGEVDPNEMRPEGPFGDHYGYYSLQHDYPVFRCKRLYHRKNAICAATVVGKPRQEDFFLGDFLQELLSPLFPLVMPTVSDLWSYGETGYHSLSAAVVKQRYKREAMVSAFRILGEGQLSLTKFLLLVDKEQDLRDFRSVLEYVLARVDLRTDLYVFSNLSMDTLDYTGPSVNEGSKGVLLGVGDPIRELPKVFSGELPRYLTHAKPFCRGCLVLQGQSFTNDPSLAKRASQEDVFREWPLVILSDEAERSVSSEMAFLWTTFTRFEPGADISSRSQTIYRNHLSYEGPLVIDARMKPNYPEELFCDETTSQLVDQRWNEYFGDNPFKLTPEAGGL